MNNPYFIFGQNKNIKTSFEGNIVMYKTIKMEFLSRAGVVFARP
jgi:hypothetical protein